MNSFCKFENYITRNQSNNKHLNEMRNVCISAYHLKISGNEHII